AQQGGLAAAGRPHDAGDLAARDADVDIVEDVARATLEGQPLQLDGIGILGAHPNSLLLGPSWDQTRHPAAGIPGAGVRPNRARNIAPPPRRPNTLQPFHNNWSQLRSRAGESAPLCRYTSFLL